MTLPPRDVAPDMSQRDYNRLRILDAIRRTGSATRTDVQALTGMSRGTVQACVDALIADGVLTELPPDVRRGRGRPAVRLRLTERAGVVIGMAFGHAHYRAAVATVSGQVLEEHTRRMAVDNSAIAALDAAADEFDALLHGIGVDDTQVAGIVVGLPAPLNRATGRVMINNILPGWVDRAPAQELAERLGIPVTLENDANLAALGEMAYGAASSARDVMFVKASIGIGLGLILGGTLHRGATGYAGEIGHVQIEPGGAVCRCGSRGCLETLVSLPHVLAALEPARGQLSVTGLIELVASGDSGATRVVADVGRTIGRSLADLCNILNPSVLVVGGELSYAGDALTDGIREAVDRYAQPIIARELRVTPSSLQDRAEMLGAIRLAIAPM